MSVWENGTETATTWEAGTPSGGPGAARAGTGAAGTDLDADYADGTTIVLRSPLIDTQGATRVNLTFWHYLEALDDEGGQVNLLDANGELIGTLFDPFIGGEDNNILEWTEEAVRLPDLDEPFIIEFQFLSVGGNEPNNGAGWFVDDVRVGK